MAAICSPWWNAIKYNREGGQVVVACEATPGGCFRVKVSDTGWGLSVEEIGRLFVQAYGTVEGTGLGLVVSRRVAEATGGSLELQSEVGRGSTFWIELPSTAIPEAAAASVPVNEPSASPSAVNGTRLLYIEDNASNTKLMHALLAKCRPQWELLTATHGSRSLERARQEAPDLILLDLPLPDLPGDRVLTELRHDPVTRDVPAIVLSADATPHSRARLLAGGAIDYVSRLPPGKTSNETRAGAAMGGPLRGRHRQTHSRPHCARHRVGQGRAQSGQRRSHDQRHKPSESSKDAGDWPDGARLPAETLAKIATGNAPCAFERNTSVLFIPFSFRVRRHGRDIAPPTRPTP